MGNEKDICEFSNEELLFRLGLYQKVKVEYNEFVEEKVQKVREWNNNNYYDEVMEIKYSKQFSRLIEFMLSDENIHAFCPVCKNKTSLRSYNVEIPIELENNVINWFYEYDFNDDSIKLANREMSDRINKIISKKREFDKIVICNHNISHRFKFSYLLEKCGEYPSEYIILRKIGQYPSISDFSSENIKKYKKILGEHDNEYSKALGLYSAGIGIGSFVYLRRIIEFLIENAFEKAETDGVVTTDDRSKKVVDKIKLLKDYIPKFVVDNSIIYSILSKGVHELNENECKEMFPIMQMSIELILDEEIARRKKEEDEKSLAKELGKIKAKIESKDGK